MATTAALRRKSRRPSPAMLKEAIKRVSGPVEASAFAPAEARVTSQVGALLARGASATEVQKAWNRLGALPPPMHVLGGNFSLAKQTVTQGLGLLAALDWIYVPGNDTSWWIRPDHHYAYEGTTNGYADKMSGHVAASASLDVAVAAKTASGAIFSQVYTAPAQYGQVSQVSFDVDLSWEAAGRFLTAVPWGEKVMGTMRLLGQLFLTVYEFNVATSSWERVVAIPRVVLDESWMGYGQYDFKHAGTVSPGQLTAKCIVSPARYYAFGVHAQMTMFNNLRSTTRGAPVPVPPPNLYPAYAWMAAALPAMYISHQVFAW
jgi:hypothetical protein